ncbi:hypothetical protein MMC18_006155, partial [Xylographa bjoerkii]|nr:hypothetical protein [Xylographa bjoerkii]
ENPSLKNLVDHPRDQVRKMLKILLIGLVLVLRVATKDEPLVDNGHEPSHLKLEKYVLDQGDNCLWQCYWLFARLLPPKDCSTETDNLTNCVCDHLLKRLKFPQCVVSICGKGVRKPGDHILSLPEEFVTSQIIFPGLIKGTAPLGIWSICADPKARESLTFTREGNLTRVIYFLLDSGEGVRWWQPVIHDKELESELYNSPRANRLPVPSWLDQLLHPIWRQDNLPGSLDYHPPPDAGNVRDPRSTMDLIDYRTIFSVYFFAIVAYAHLLHLVSESERYWIEALQVIMFIILPGLPTIQLVNSFFKVVFKSAWSSGFRYNISALCGQYVFERRTTSNYRARLVYVSLPEVEVEEQDYSSGQFWGRTLAISANFYLVTARFAAYVRRLRTTMPGEDHTAIYISATGMDHRIGWVAFGGMVSTLVTLLRHVMNVEWSTNPCLHLRQRSTFDWKMEIWLEIVAAAIGQSMLMRLTNRISTSTLRSRIIDVDIGGYLVTTATLLVLFCIQYRVPLMAGIQRRSSGVRRILRGLFVTGSALYIATVAFLQIFTDVEEIADIKLGWVFGWNYLWTVPEPNWLML